jgi:hypothetical protein
VTPVGQARDLQIAQLSCAAGQYRAASQELTLFDSVEYQVNFSGGEGGFVTEVSLSPFEGTTHNYASGTINERDIYNYALPDVIDRICAGEELLILTHPLFRLAADRLAQWKNDKGIPTRVIEVNDGEGPGPDTAELIDDLIEWRYDNCFVRPSYILLMGDAEFIPPSAYVDSIFSQETGTDYRYANYPQFIFDILPDFGVGRIPVDTRSESLRVVGRIIRYESEPPTSDSFYENVSIASQFQCCRMDPNGLPLGGQAGTDQRAFIETSELVRDELVDEGYTVERIYTETVDLGGYCLDPNCIWVQAPYSGGTTPERYYNGALLPPALGLGSGFNWGAAATQDIIDAFNDGRFLIYQRDHGDWDEWTHPSFTKDNVSNDLNNALLLPVVFSISCSAGFFDDETNPGADLYNYPSVPTDPNLAGETYLAERLLRDRTGGAIGVIGASRHSPSWANNALTLGLFDALWPEMVPTYGDATAKHRLGDILNHAKIYVLNQADVAGTGEEYGFRSVITELFIFHVLGDPTLGVWTKKPVFVLDPEYSMQAGDRELLVSYATEGATLTAFQETPSGVLPIGRAPVENGMASMEYVQQPDPNTPILLSASLAHAVSLLLTPRTNEPRDLADESAFSPGVTRITFDPEEGRTVNEHISDQYAALGVLFVDDATTTPTILAEYQRGGPTHSDPYSLSNIADTVLPGSANVPFTMLFDPPIRGAGMYIGNGGFGLTAILSAHDSSGDLIFAVDRWIMGNDVQTFIGMDVGTASIAELRLDYGDTLVVEEIDDLLFE